MTMSKIVAVSATAALFATPAFAQSLGQSLREPPGGAVFTLAQGQGDHHGYVAPGTTETDPLVLRASAQLQQRRFADAAPLLRALADGGNVWAMRRLATLHIHGQGVARDTGAALILLRSAASLGDHESALALGVAYARAGRPDEARRWLDQALTSDSEHVRIDARRVLATLD